MISEFKNFDKTGQIRRKPTRSANICYDLWVFLLLKDFLRKILTTEYRIVKSEKSMSVVH